MRFQIGHHVVCVNDNFPSNATDYFSSLPKSGTQYVVRDMDRAPDFESNEVGLGLALVGISGKMYWDGETLFAACRFRPLDELKEESRKHHEKNHPKVPITPQAGQ